LQKETRPECAISSAKVSRGLLGGLDWPLALTALGMDWTEDDTMKTTVNDISNITFIKL